MLIINFWATFCKPCVEEIPDLIKLSKQCKKEKVTLYLVSLDLKDYYPKKIQKFVAQKKYAANIAWLNESNADYFFAVVGMQLRQAAERGNNNCRATFWLFYQAYQ